MDIHAERFPLSALLEDIQATFQPLTAEKGLEFAVEADAEAPAELLTDRQRLRQVLGNLLSNAVKFTERGHVLLRVGPGPAAAQARTAARCWHSPWPTPGSASRRRTSPRSSARSSRATARSAAGTAGPASGLSIAREVGALLGGEITAESELGQGSTFTLYLPCELPGAAADGDGARASDGTGAARERRRRHAEATEALQLQPAVPDDTAAGRPAPAGPGGRARRPADAARLQRGLRPDRHPRTGARGHGGQPGAGHRGAQRRAAPVRGARPRPGGRLRLRLPRAAPGGPELRDVPVLAHTRDKLDSAQARLARLRFGAQPLELLPSLDELRERITLHLSAAQPDHVPALISEPAETVPSRGAAPHGRGARGAARQAGPGDRRRRAQRVRDH